MSRNRLILACAALLPFGLWIAWHSVSAVDAGAPQGDPETAAAHEPAPPEEPSSPASILDSPGPETESSRAPAIIEPKSETRTPLLVAGIVVDDHDVPIASADVYVREEENGSPSAEANSRPRRPPTHVTTDAAGRFELHGVRESLHLLAFASKPGYFGSERVSFERGAIQVHLVLGNGGVVGGRILVDPGIPMDLLRVRLEGSGGRSDYMPIRRQHRRSADEGEHATDPSLCSPSVDGTFAFEGVAAKSARITVTIQNQGSPVADIDSIRVREIGEPGDPRLEPLDLRGALETFAIDVQDDAGRKCSGATVVLGDPRGRFEDRGKVTQDGRATFLAPSGAYDVDVDLTGWRREHLRAVQSDQVVRLRKGMPVRVILDGSGDLPASPYRLVVGLLVDVAQPRSVVDGMGVFAEGRETTLLASSPGLHEVAWYVENGTRQTFLIGTPRRVVEIREGEEEESIHLELSGAVRDSWEATIRRLESDAERLRTKSDGIR